MPLALSKLIVESKSESTSDENPKFDLLLLCKYDGTDARSLKEFLFTEGGTDLFKSKS